MIATPLKASQYNREVDNLLAATQRPFTTRLQAAIYLALRNDMGQEQAQELAYKAASIVRTCVYVKPNSKPGVGKDTKRPLSL